MKKVIIAIGIASLLAACAKKELWETDEHKYKFMISHCLADYHAAEYDTSFTIDKKCFKFAKYFEKQEGKPLFPKEFLQVLQKGQQ